MYFETQKLSVGYHRRPLIEDIDIGIWQGGILCLIGPNGSGKSTILRSITRHLTKLGGVVAIGGRDLDGMSDKELARLNKEKAKAEKELAMFENQLNNPKFVERAPAALVEDIRAKHAKSQDKLANIEQSIKALG